MIKRSIEFSNLKHGRTTTQKELAKHLSMQGFGDKKKIEVMFSRLNSGKQKSVNDLSMIPVIAKFLDITTDVVLSFVKKD